MRILYGVQTTGNGHLSRSRLVIRHLKQFGHDVHVIFSGANNTRLWDLSQLEPYTRFKGLTFVHKNGKIDELNTVLKLDLQRFYMDIRSFDASDFNLVISDFEPISVRIARRYNIQSIGLSHQCAFCHDIPKAPGNYMGKLVTRMFAPVDLPVGLHWHHFDQPLLPPIVNHRLTCDLPVETNKILVYLPFENRDQVKNQLLNFPGYEFFVYENRNQPNVEENIHWQPFSRPNFINDLKTASGVYCQAGFELPSEALHLGKKLLLKPVKGQYEQLSNVRAINQLGCGMTTMDFNSEALRIWLEQSMIDSAGYPDVARCIAQWISEDPSLSVELLSSYLWDKTIRPPLKLKFIAA